MWGTEPFTGGMQESYVEAQGQQRLVQYFDKSRMEINHDPSIPVDSPWHVTNGLLVVELMTGRLQDGDASFLPRIPATVNVAGDPDDPDALTYAIMGAYMDAQPLPDGATIIHLITRGSAGVLYNDKYAAYGVTAAHYVPETNHQVASVFWEFMNASGTVYEDGDYHDAALFLNPFYATGYPVTEAYWDSVKVSGVYMDVLMQCFERRCLTYTPGNAEGWKVEAGNVGRHYHTWRYGGDTEPPTGEYRVSVSWEVQFYPGDMDTDDSGNVYVVTEAYGESLQSFNSFGNHRFTIRKTDYELDDIFDVSVVGSGEDGFFCLLGEADLVRVVLYFDTFGTLLGGWVPPSSMLPGSIDCSTRGYVTLVGMDRVMWFTPLGEPIGSAKFEGRLLNDVAVDDVSGASYITDALTGAVIKLNATGSLAAIWHGKGVYNIAVDSAGNVFATAYSACQVLVLTPNGETVTSFGSCGQGTGQFDHPTGIAVDIIGNVYVTESDLHRVQKFVRT
jgi:DNA-binding beta-propeller fold protein YncE